MTSQKIQDKGILAKLLEKCITILVKNECYKIGKINVDIIASSVQIIKGIIHKIHIFQKNKKNTSLIKFITSLYIMELILSFIINIFFYY